MQISKVLKHVIAVAAFAAAGSASAAAIEVGFNMNFGGELTSSTGDITTSTSVSLSSTGTYVIGDLEAGNANNAGAVGTVPFVSFGTQVSLSNPMPLTLNSVFEKSFTTSVGTFIETLKVVNVNTGAGNRSILATGTITCSGCGLDDSPVFFSASYTQNPLGQIAASFNNSTTPPPAVPEPGSMALVGLALAGLGLTARRRAAK